MPRMHTVLLLLLILFIGSCSEDIVDQPRVNETPKTFLWLFPDSTLRTGVSLQHLRWWGEDPDGLVQGFLFGYVTSNGGPSSLPSPDTITYSFLRTNDTLISFPLDTLFKEYTVFVRAIDNSARMIPHGSIVHVGTDPYLDKNGNGIFDGVDERLPDLPGAIDRGAAIQTFPIRNTPPTLRFADNPNDPSIAFKQPDTSYTVATFAWKGADADGDQTLASYRIALNDTTDPSRWVTIPIRDTVITLVVPRSRSDAADSLVDADIYGGRFLGRQLLGRIQGLRLDGLNKLIVQVRDVAGEYSQPLTMPSGTNTWYVKKPRGKLLLVSDYVNFDRDLALSTYVNSLAAVPGGEYTLVDRLDMGLGLNAADKEAGRLGTQVPPFMDPALIQTFLLFDVVLWYTEQVPSLGVAQQSLFAYLQNGGRVIFSTSFKFSVDSRGAFNDFAPIDSISSVDLSGAQPPPRLGDTRVPANYQVLPDSTTPGNVYPLLAFNSTPSIHSIFMRPIYKRSDARYIYRLQEDVAGRYIGSPNIGVVDGQGTIIFVALPLHLLNNIVQGNPLGITAFLSKALLQGFNVQQKINRRRF
ncbi:MAG TPA: hypothetical protein VGB89_04340 [Bacteroidota bacterium]